VWALPRVGGEASNGEVDAGAGSVSPTVTSALNDWLARSRKNQGGAGAVSPRVGAAAAGAAESPVFEAGAAEGEAAPGVAPAVSSALSGWLARSRVQGAGVGVTVRRRGDSPAGGGLSPLSDRGGAANDGSATAGFGGAEGCRVAPAPAQQQPCRPGRRQPLHPRAGRPTRCR
jgi:hypothetical protein